MPRPKITSPSWFNQEAFPTLSQMCCVMATNTARPQADEAEVAAFMAKHADLKTGDGHQRIVRHGHLPEREIMTYIGSVAVRQPRVRDRSTDGDLAAPTRFRHISSVLAQLF